MQSRAEPDSFSVGGTGTVLYCIQDSTGRGDSSVRECGGSSSSSFGTSRRCTVRTSCTRAQQKRESLDSKTQPQPQQQYEQPQLSLRSLSAANSSPASHSLLDAAVVMNDARWHTARLVSSRLVTFTCFVSFRCCGAAARQSYDSTVQYSKVQNMAQVSYRTVLYSVQDYRFGAERSDALFNFRIFRCR